MSNNIQLWKSTDLVSALKADAFDDVCSFYADSIFWALTDTNKTNISDDPTQTPLPIRMIKACVLLLSSWAQ
eukprot:9881368-Ditylum_brightwellii.AAC.1